LKIEKQFGNLRVAFDTEWSKRIAPGDFLANLPGQIAVHRLDGATTEETTAAERFYLASYLKALLEELEESSGT